MRRGTEAPGGSIAIPPLAVEALCLLLALLALHPLLVPGYQKGHDTPMHLFRAAEVARSLRDGVLYPRFVPDAYSGLGGPIMNFNPVLPYYLPAILVVLGLGPIAALKVAAGIAFIAGGIAVRIFARPHAGRIGAAVAGLAYVYLPYHISDIYVRMAFPELVSMIFIPLALAAARRASRTPTPRTIAMSGLTMALILATHFPASVVGLPLVLLYALVVSRRGRFVKAASAFAASAALALALSAFSWLPALAEQAGTHYEESTGGYGNYRNHFVDWPLLFSTTWGFGQSPEGSRDRMSFQIGWVHLLALAAAIVVAVRRPRLRAAVGFAATAAAGGSTLMLPQARTIWDHLAVVQDIQFPWRLLMDVGVGTSLAVGIVAGAPFDPTAASAGSRIAGARKGSRRGRGPARGEVGASAGSGALGIALLALTILLLVGACVPYLKVQSGEVTDAEFTPEAMRREYFGELRFQPKEVEKAYIAATGPPAVLLDAGGAPLPGGTATLVEDRTHHMSVEVDAPVPSVLRLHLLDTPGWKARADGVEVKVRAEPRTAFVLVDLPAGRHRVDLRFGHTPVRLAAWILTALGAIAGAGAVLLIGRRAPAERHLAPSAS